ncbi:unnamed protein product [Bathycoccus prasinos]
MPGGVTLLSSSRLMTTTSSPPPSPKGFYELRRYKIPPAKRAEYIKLCEESSQLRKKLTQNGFCGFYVPEVGSELNTVTHVYHYEDYDHRDKSLGMVEEQTSEVYIEAAVATKSAGLHVNSFKEKASKDEDSNASSSIFEIRTYTLQLGYNPIPKMQNLYAEGLPSKIASDTEKLSELVWIGYADVGDLNKFVEIWKYPSYQSHIKVREAARTADAWRETIGKIAPMVTHFNTTLCSAAPFSPSSSSSSKKPQQRERGRLRIVVNSGDFNEEKVGIVLVDHGSRAKSSNEQLERFAEMFEMMYGSTIGGDYNSDDNNSYSKERKYEVAPAHMELASPSIADAFRELIETKNCRKIVVAPFFLSPGRGKYELEYMVAAPIALHPLMTTIIHERVEKCLEVNEKGAGECDVCGRKDAGISCKMKRV